MGTGFFRFATMHAFDGRTDRRTDGRTKRPWKYRALHYMQSHGKNNTDRAYATAIIRQAGKHSYAMGKA